MNNINTFDTTTLWSATPEIFLLSAIVVVLLLDLFLTKSFKQTTYYLTQASLFIAGALAFNLINEPQTIIFGGSFILDNMASVFKVFMVGSAMVAMVYTRHYLTQHALFRGEYFILVMLSV